MFQFLLGNKPDFVVSVEYPGGTVVTGRVVKLGVVFAGIPNGLCQFSSLSCPRVKRKHGISTKGAVKRTNIMKYLFNNHGYHTHFVRKAKIKGSLLRSYIL